MKDVSDLVGLNSWFLVEKAAIGDMDLLSKKAQFWPQSTPYLQLQQFLSKLAVVNDSAEHGVKLVQDYVDSTQD